MNLIMKFFFVNQNIFRPVMNDYFLKYINLFKRLILHSDIFFFKTQTSLIKFNSEILLPFS